MGAEKGEEPIEVVVVVRLLARLARAENESNTLL